MNSEESRGLKDVDKKTTSGPVRLERNFRESLITQKSGNRGIIKLGNMSQENDLNVHKKTTSGTVRLETTETTTSGPVRLPINFREDLIREAEKKLLTLQEIGTQASVELTLRSSMSPEEYQRRLDLEERKKK